MTILYFFIALGVLISIHEFGHFIVAKLCGVKVEEFSLGFGPRLIGWKRGETEYRLSLLPLGGYVKMLGEQPGEAGSDDPRAFTRKPIWKRALIVVFGPVMNIVLCLALFPLVFMIGRDVPAFFIEPPVVKNVLENSAAAQANLMKEDRIIEVNGRSVATWETLLTETLSSRPTSKVKLLIERQGSIQTIELDRKAPRVGEKAYLGIEPPLFLGNEPIIGKVESGSPAEKGGLQQQDRVVAVNDVPLSWWTELSEKIQEARGKPVVLTLLRGTERVTATIAPIFESSSERWRLGIQKGEGTPLTLITKKFGFAGALKEGCREFYKLSILTFDILKKLLSFQLSYKVLGGPLMIAKTTAEAAKAGVSDFLYFLGFMSLQLALLNLLPIPVLDGGHLFFLGLEGIRQKPLNPKFQLVAQQIGFSLLILLLITVTMNDVNAIWGVGNFFKSLF